MVCLTSVLLTIVIGCIILFFTRWFVQRYYKHQLLRRYGIPGPRPDLFFGNSKELRKNETPHHIIDLWLKKYGDVFGFYIGEEPFIVVNDLEIIKQVMIKDFSVFPNRPDLLMELHPFSDTIVGLKDERWKEVRSIISPTFSSSKLKLVKGIFDKKVDITVDIVNKKVKNEEMFDIYRVIQGLTLDVIADSALAMKTRCQEDPNDKLLVALQSFQQTAQSYAVDLGEMFPFLKPFFAFIANNFTKFSKFNSLILGNLKNVVEERRNNPELKSKDVLQLMLDSSEEGTNKSTRLTDSEVLANAYLAFIAGFETTSTALAFTFYLLVKHPDVQERLFEEIDKAPDSSYSTLQGLHYLSQVFDEALRLYPPVTGFVTRICKQDHKIGSYTFPKGSAIYVPVWQLHHNSDYFPNPWTFDPDRFSPENKRSIKNMSYLPFGEGPRNCMGARFALLEARLAILKLLKSYKFVQCERTEENLSLLSPTIIITTPANGVWVRAVPRVSV